MAEQSIYACIDHLLAGVPSYTSSDAALRIQTLGGFRVWRNGSEIEAGEWGREKAIHLFLFFVTANRQYLHKEQIIDRLWPELDTEKGDRDFKVALNSVNRALEPDRAPRSEPRFIRRHGLAYGLDPECAWLDCEAFELLVAAGNQAIEQSVHDQCAHAAAVDRAIACYTAAVGLYSGDYLPPFRYEDWTSATRERLQVLALGVMTRLAELMSTRNALESLRLTQRVLSLDPVWEDAYRIQMKAYAAHGNRPLALRTYRQCVENLQREFGVDPLPETQALYEQIQRGAFKMDCADP